MVKKFASHALGTNINFESNKYKQMLISKKQSILIIISFCLPALLLGQEAKIRYDLHSLTDSALQRNLSIQNNALNDSLSYLDIKLMAKEYQPYISSLATFSYWDWLLPNKEKLLGTGNNTDMYIQLSAYQLIYDWGKIASEKKLKQADVSINKKLTEQLNLNIALNITNQYLEALLVKNKISNFNSSINQSENHLKIAENLYKIGQISNVDILKIKVSLSILKKELQTAQYEYQQNIEILKKLAYIYDDNFEITGNTQKLYSKNLLYQKDSSIGNQPIITQFNEKISKEKIQKELYKKAITPQLYSYAATNWEHSYIPFGKNFNYNIGIGIQYTIPYLGGSRYKENILKSDIKLEQIKLQKEQTIIDLNNEIKLVELQIESKENEISINKNILELARESYQNILIMYEAGQEIILNVLDAQTILNQQDIIYDKSKIEYLELVSKWNYLFGKKGYLLD